MNAPANIEVENVYQRLNRARQIFHAMELRKSGRNTFANYSYFELGDFLIPALKIFDDVGLCPLPISFTADEAKMTIVRVDDPEDCIVFTSPMGSAALKGCHEVQNIGAVETYQRRYLWVAALEIVEHDALDAGGSERDNSKGQVSPTGTADQPQGWRITDEQLVKIQMLLKATKISEVTFCRVMGEPENGRLFQLPQSKYAEAVERLETKLEKMAKGETNAKATENA